MIMGEGLSTIAIFADQGGGVNVISTFAEFLCINIKNRAILESGHFAYMGRGSGPILT